MAKSSTVSPTVEPNIPRGDKDEDEYEEEDWVVSLRDKEEIKELKAQVNSLKNDLVKSHEGKCKLDTMLSVQQSPNDKSGLGFKSNNKDKSKNNKNKKGQVQFKDPAKIVCFKCKIEGHHVRSCPLKKKQKGKRPQVQTHIQPQVEEMPLSKKKQANAPIVEKSSEKKEKKRTCYICREKGHISSFCTIGTSSNSITIDDVYSLRWRKRWLYVHEESSDSMEYNIAPFDGKAKILRRRSWDAEASEEEKLATEALMTRIRELQSTRGKELSGIQITAYFLRIRMQPLQARKNPLWMYAGNEDVERLSTDLSAKYLEKLIRRISKLSKKDTIPSSYKVTPFCRANPLPKGASRPESGVGDSHKSTASLEKENETEVSSSTRSSLPAASPKGKRKRDEAIDSGASKANTSRAEKTALNAEEETLDLYGAALVSSDDEEEDAPIDETARTSTSRTLVVSEARPDGDETSPPPQNLEHPKPAESPRAPSPKRARVETTKEPTILAGCSSTSLMEEPFMKELVRFGTQFIGYRDYAGELEEANKRADALAIELEQSESAHAKIVEDLQKRLDDAKRALEENVAQHSAREEEILSRLETQSRRFVRRTHQEYELENPEDDELLDALSLLEIHGAEAHNGLDEAEAGLSRLFPYFFHKKERPAVFIDLAKCFNGNEDLGLQLRQEGLKVGVEGTMALVAESQQQVDWSKVGDAGKIETKKWQSLIKAAKPNSKKILATLGYKPTTAPSSSKPEIIFDNYTATPGPSEVFASSHSKKTPVSVEFVENSSSKNSAEDLEELRQQLQSTKKQSLMLMEQSRKSSERENVALQQAQDAITEKDAAVAEAAAATSRENFMLQLLTDASLDMAGSFLDAATEDERVEARSNLLLRLAHDHGSNFWGTPERTRQIVRFQDCALQVRDYLDFCTRTLSLVYGTMFPRNKMPETLPALMDKFRDAPRIHGFVRAQLAAGARFAMIMIKICYPKLDVGQIVPKCLAKMAKRKKNFGKYDDIVTPVAEDMMDELLRMDAEFFVKGSYAEHSTRAINNERLTIDNILGNL
ncbi:hypothetical protein QYE76_034586 [Lolium multiflorum]|uniref:CCHC-type domain-containing protein n=1 Tax=Lolium multiflorum TaxID=4521 RepID=A0AAD8QXN1_LOLMU|nr:hypothetical protein QYE76_034586 [Lolium multiflorum]